MNIRSNYNHTLYASYLGYITQAIVNNFAPLLFLTFQRSYNISLEKIALLVFINFGIQLLVDLLSTIFADRIGYRISIVSAHILSAAGLVGLGILPGLFSSHYAGLVAAVVLYAIGGGLIEVLVSPIVEACPTERKSASMSLLHSFYCWGQVLVVLGSTLFFTFAGISNWQLLTFLWASIPLFNAFYFTMVPIGKLVEEEKGLSIRQLCSMKTFWVFMLLMVGAGASEMAMSQWASAFAEAGLKVSKTIGDLSGPCFFAVMMGISRVFYAKYSEKIELWKLMLGGSILCIFSYLLAVFAPHPSIALLALGLCGLSVSFFWPGTFSLASKGCPTGGTAMFALLALAGDLGCSSGPALVGFVSGIFNNDLKNGLLAAIIFPLIMGFSLISYKRKFATKSAAQAGNS